jgi:hypothetical protein
MPTTSQIKIIQLGKKLLDLTEPQYRMLLHNVAGVESCKDLNNVGVEDVMAVMEGMGFDSHPSGATYWRDKVSARGTFANARMVHKIHALAPLQRYDLGAQVMKFTGGRSERPEHLRPHEAWALIEMLKAAGAREATHGT